MRKYIFCLCLLLLNACASIPKSSEQGYRVAAAQFLIEANQKPEKFFSKVETLVQQASHEKMHLIVLPELLVMDTWPLGSKVPEKELARTMATELTPSYFKKVIELSARYQIAVLAGSAPRLVGAKIFNTALLVFPDGRKIYQDKVFLTQWEKEQGWSAGESIRVFDAPWGRSVILICFDAEFPLLSQLLAKHQPEWIFIPSMTESVAGLNRVRSSAQARAIEHHAFVVVAGTVGRPDHDWVHHGQGVLFEPWEGRFKGVVSEGEKDKPGLVFGQFDIEVLRTSRASSKFFPGKEQRRDRKIFIETP